MVKKIKLETAEDLKRFMNLAWECSDDVGVHTDDGGIADAKSILGLIALDYSQPVMVVSENEQFFKKLAKWLVEPA
jgi:phosphotransferase system HPr-like phosphotransfer protein